jgi:DNA-binding NtrC family response regulator
VIGDKAACGLVSKDPDMLRLAERGYTRAVRFSREAMRPMMNCPGPRSVRELADRVEYSLICAIDGVVQPESLPGTLWPYCAARPQPVSKHAPLVDDRVVIQKALQEAGGNKTLTVQIIGIDRRTLRRNMQKPGIE